MIVLNNLTKLEFLSYLKFSMKDYTKAAALKTKAILDKGLSFLYPGYYI